MYSIQKNGDVAYVIGPTPNGKRWLLSSGRTAKKETEGKTWHRLHILGRIQFHGYYGDLVNVVGEKKNCWVLGSGRIAKKNTCGKTWVWQKPKPSGCATCGSTERTLRWNHCPISLENCNTFKYGWWCEVCLDEAERETY